MINHPGFIAGALLGGDSGGVDECKQATTCFQFSSSAGFAFGFLVLKVGKER